MKILPADLDDPRVVALLESHTRMARAQTAAGSAHALDLDGLRAANVRVWTIWSADVLLGVGALKWIAPDHGELKSMYTTPASRRTGVGRAMLGHIFAVAKEAGLSRLSLETGSWDYFRPARDFYRRHGFVGSPPFGDYVADPNSVFMTLDLRASA